MRELALLLALAFSFYTAVQTIERCFQPASYNKQYTPMALATCMRDRSKNCFQ